MSRSKLFFIAFLALTVAETTICHQKPRFSVDEKKSDKTELRVYQEWLNYYGLIVGSMITFQAYTLYILGQPMISRTGGIRLWCGEIQGPENSQHMTDWYTFTHILHGLVFYWILGIIFPSASIALRFLLSLAMEIVWEVLENSPIIIKRYRQSAIAIGYFGDSILNSVSDTLAMSLGFYLTSKFPASIMVTFAILMEAFCAYSIRDNFALNLIQLIHPLDAISRWQTSLWNNIKTDNNVR